MGRSMQVSVSIPANGAVNDVFTDQGINAFFGAAGNVTFYAGARAIGLTQNMAYDDGVDQRNVIPNGSVVSLESTVGALKTNEGFVQQFAVPAGSKLILNVQNTTAGAVIYDAMAIIT